MGAIKGILALGLFFLFAPLFLFSIGAVFVILWSVVGFLFSTVLPLVIAFIVIFSVLLIPVFFIDLNKRIKEKEREKAI